MARAIAQDLKASLQFNGTSTTISLGSPAALTSLTDMTIEGWIKPSPIATNNTIMSAGFNYGTNNGFIFMVAGSNSANSRLLLFQGNVSTSSNNGSVVAGVWQHVAVVQAGNTIAYYVNGVQSGITVALTQRAQAAVATYIGTEGASSNYFKGNMSRLRIYNRALSATEITQRYQNARITSGLIEELDLAEGAGSTAIDTSSSANNGTITGATYTADTPSKARKLIGSNLLYNGSMEFAPPSAANVATTSNNRWIDGTAGGAASNTLFGWYMRQRNGTISSQFDYSTFNSGLASLKVSTTATNSWNQTQFICAGGIPVVGDPNIIAAVAGRNYTFSGWIKTTVNSGAAATGARLALYQYNAGGGQIGVLNLGNVTTSTGWTFYSGTYTALAGNGYLIPMAEVVGSDGATTLIMDAWFDDISITETIPVFRTTPQDFKSALNFNGTTTFVSVPTSANNDFTGPFTVSAWVKQTTVSVLATAEQAILSKPLANGTNYRYILAFGDNPYFSLYDGTNNPQAVAPSSVSSAATLGRWQHIVGVNNGATIAIYVNGVLKTSIANNATLVSSAGAFEIGRRAGGSNNYFKGLIAAVKTFASALTPTQIAQEYATGSNAIAAGQIHLLGEGAGGTAFDTSGNANNGTITASSFVGDVPTRKRQLVGGNLVTNGDMSFIPPFTAATGNTTTFIDGTAGGSTTNNLFKYGMIFFSGGGPAAFDTVTTINNKTSISLTANAGSRGALLYGNNGNGGVSPATQCLIPVNPSTSYTLTYWLKTDANVAANSACGGWRFYNGDFSAGAETLSATKFGPSTAWTQVTDTFTTASTTRYLLLQARQDVTPSVAATIWWGDIQLVPTVNTTRALA